MGASFTNYQVRTKSNSAVQKALLGLIRSRAYVSPEKAGWVTVYDESSDEQDEATLGRIATELSKALDTVVLAFLVHDSDIAAYWLYQKGVLADEFNSAPDYFDENISTEARARVRGNPDALLPLCVPGTTRADVEAILHPTDGLPLMAEGILTDLAPLLGIDDARISLGFEYFDQEGEDLLPDSSEFEPVGKNTARKKAQTSEPTGQPAAPILDMFPLAIGMLTKCWDGEQEKMAQAFATRFSGQDAKSMLKQLSAGFDRGARDFLKQSALPNCPTIDELKKARDEGPDALAKLLVKRAPTQLGSIADGAIQSKLESFIAALLANGLNPNEKNQHGESILVAAERHAKDTPIYDLLKGAADKKTNP
jgi:hypothetical protein